MTGNEIVPARGTLAVTGRQDFWTEQQLAALRQLGVDEASNGDLAVFLNYAQRTGLDPFSRQIYMIGRWENRTRSKKWTIQASIDGLRIIAQRSGDYAGQVGPEWCGMDGQWHDVWLAPVPPAAARVGVLRRGFTAPLYAVALFREYAGTDKDGNLTAMWRDKGALMIAKCAEALALRKAFPHDLSGIYTAEEMTRADTGHATPPPMSRPALPPRDWAADAAAAATVEELRGVWRAAHDAGALSPEVTDAINRRAATLAQDTAAETPPEAGTGTDQAGLVDAEIVEETPPPPAPPPPAASRAQLTAVAAGMSACGWTDRADRLRLASAVARRDLSTSKELTRAEAAELLDALAWARSTDDPQAALAGLLEATGGEQGD